LKNGVKLIPADPVVNARCEVGRHTEPERLSHASFVRTEPRQLRPLRGYGLSNGHSRFTRVEELQNRCLRNDKYGVYEAHVPERIPNRIHFYR
jgi:hypothetical protein